MESMGEDQGFGVGFRGTANAPGTAHGGAAAEPHPRSAAAIRHSRRDHSSPTTVVIRTTPLASVAPAKQLLHQVGVSTVLASRWAEAVLPARRL